VIAIIDNGRQYSDHELWFVDVGDEDPRQIGQMMACVPTYRGAHVIASAPTFEWYTSEAIALEDVIDNIIDRLSASTVNDLKRENLAALETLLRLVANKGSETFLSRLRSAIAAKQAATTGTTRGFARPFTAAELDAIPMDDDYHD